MELFQRRESPKGSRELLLSQCSCRRETASMACQWLQAFPCTLDITAKAIVVPTSIPLLQRLTVSSPARPQPISRTLVSGPVVFLPASPTLATIVGCSEGRKIHYDLHNQRFCNTYAPILVQSTSIAKICMGMHEDVFNNLLSHILPRPPRWARR